MLDEGGSQPYHCLGPSHHQCVPGLLQLASLLYHLPVLSVTLGTSGLRAHLSGSLFVLE